jgi:dienelactone hydrolase
MRLRALALWMVAALAVQGSAGAQSIVREELRIPMAGTGPRGLEAVLVRPTEPGKFPLALINHGAPREARDRPGMTPLNYVPHAMEFARRGFATLTVMRRNYGDSGGSYAESNGPCDNPNYVTSGIASTVDLRAAIAGIATRPYIDSSRVISIGQSAGGFATVALTADPPPGLVAGISFAGGRGSPGPDKVCHEERLVEAFRTFGQRARLPMLWVYAENDHFFGPALAQRLREAFTAGGGKVEFVAAPAYGEDGHSLFSAAGVALWTPFVDRFLKSHNLMPRANLIDLPIPKIAPPRQLSTDGRTAFNTFLRAAPHKVFAVSPSGAYGWTTGRRTAEEARTRALDNCSQHARDCKVVVVDDAAVP